MFLNLVEGLKRAGLPVSVYARIHLKLRGNGRKGDAGDELRDKGRLRPFQDWNGRLFFRTEVVAHRPLITGGGVETGYTAS